jgi:cobalt-zinc-cadmium efflux system membrane fusion protein
MIPKHALLALVLAAAPLATVFSSCRSKPNASREESEPSLAAATREGNRIKFPAGHPQLSRIRTAPVETAQVPQDEVAAPGKIELDPGRLSHVALPVPGRINRVLVGLGDAVTAGQPILTLESTEVSAVMSALRQASANLSQATATLAKSEADLARTRDLLADRAIAQKEVLAAEATVAQSRAGVEQAQAERDEAMRKLEILGLKPGSMDQRVTVKAPVSGKVVELTIASGDYRNDTNTPVMTIADLSSVWVAADVPEDRIRLIRPGETVEISMPAFPGERLTGRVRKIGDAVDAQTRTIKVRAEVANPYGRYKPEMFASLRYAHGYSVLPIVPRGAVLQQQDRNTVFVECKPGEFEEVPVVIAWQDDKRVAIRQGLKAGDRVVVDGITQLKAY